MIDFFLHLDQHVRDLILDYGAWTYAILGIIVFCETGLVIMPFLPGDSLLFAAGIYTNPEKGSLNVWTLMLVLAAAAIIGDNVNYHLGKWLGPKVFKNENSRIFKRSFLDKTNAFYERYGAKTVILARFVPIVRTFSPFVAGMGAMAYPKFMANSVVGAFLWVGVCVGAGYWFGGLEVVRKNFSIIVLAVILLSVLPMIYEVIKHKRGAARALAKVKEADD